MHQLISQLATHLLKEGVRSAFLGHPHSHVDRLQELLPPGIEMHRNDDGRYMLYKKGRWSTDDLARAFVSDKHMARLLGIPCESTVWDDRGTYRCSTILFATLDRRLRRWNKQHALQDRQVYLCSFWCPTRSHAEKWVSKNLPLYEASLAKLDPRWTVFAEYTIVP